MACEHHKFGVTANVARLTNEQDVVNGFMLEVRVGCTDCGRQFQFLGLEPGVDTRGARMSVDGMEAFIAICPQGEKPSPLDRIAASIGTGIPIERKH